jgi:hypothetical protein
MRIGKDTAQDTVDFARLGNSNSLCAAIDARLVFFVSTHRDRRGYKSRPLMQRGGPDVAARG